MGLRPDFARTATGYFWSDRITAPYWRWLDHRTQRTFYLLFGRTEEEGRRWVQEHWDDEEPPNES